jgi:hypothetical protein
MGIEKLGLGLASVGALAIPPARTIAVDLSIVGRFNGDARAGYSDQRTVPFLVAEGGGTLENDLSRIIRYGFSSA